MNVISLGRKEGLTENTTVKGRCDTSLINLEVIDIVILEVPEIAVVRSYELTIITSPILELEYIEDAEVSLRLVGINTVTIYLASDLRHIQRSEEVVRVNATGDSSYEVAIAISSLKNNAYVSIEFSR